MLGWSTASYGVGNTVAASFWVLFFGALAAGLAHELRRQVRAHHEFDDIEARHEVARALEGERR